MLDQSLYTPEVVAKITEDFSASQSNNLDDFRRFALAGDNLEVIPVNFLRKKTDTQLTSLLSLLRLRCFPEIAFMVNSVEVAQSKINQAQKNLMVVPNKLYQIYSTILSPLNGKGEFILPFYVSCACCKPLESFNDGSDHLHQLFETISSNGISGVFLGRAHVLPQYKDIRFCEFTPHFPELFATKYPAKEVEIQLRQTFGTTAYGTTEKSELAPSRLMK